MLHLLAYLLRLQQRKYIRWQVRLCNTGEISNHLLVARVYLMWTISIFMQGSCLVLVSEQLWISHVGSPVGHL